mgnify:CR=1 FL=1|jgi:hypothetical protein
MSQGLFSLILTKSLYFEIIKSMKVDRLICCSVFKLMALIRFREARRYPHASAPLRAFFDGVRNGQAPSSWEDEMFYVEGSSFREAGVSSILNNKYDPSRYLPSHDFPALRYLGYGFWNGFSRAFNINRPFLFEGQSYKSERWLKFADDGEGFSTSLFTPEKKLQKRTSRLNSKNLKNIRFNLGYGRALWWRFGSKIELDHLGERERIVLLSGASLAATFTQVGCEKNIDSSLQSLIKRFPRDEGYIEDAKILALNVLAGQSPTMSSFIYGDYKIKPSIGGDELYEEFSISLLKAGR